LSEPLYFQIWRLHVADARHGSLFSRSNNSSRSTKGCDKAAARDTEKLVTNWHRRLGLDQLAHGWRAKPFNLDRKYLLLDLEVRLSRVFSYVVEIS
jgi:hypothetical protein